MDDFNFQDYRQPWETGDHWELKREFIERYKNDYPVDRLLCLAQAYSNIELLHCSYPDQVMREIHDLSKPLQSCKMFRERIAKSSSQADDQEKFSKTGKSKAFEPDFIRPKKMIKFCSASEPSDITQSEKSTDKSQAFEQDFSPPRKVLKLCTGSEASDTHQKKKQVSVQENSIQVAIADICSSELSTSQICKDAPPNLSGIDEKIVNNLEKIAQEIRNQIVLKRSPIEAIHIASQKSKIKVRFDIKSAKSEPNKVGAKYDRICNFFVEDFLISSGEGNCNKKAKADAAEHGISHLMAPSNLRARLLDKFNKDSVCSSSANQDTSLKTNLSNVSEAKQSFHSKSISCDSNLLDNVKLSATESAFSESNNLQNKKYILLNSDDSVFYERQHSNKNMTKELAICSISDNDVNLVYRFKEKLKTYCTKNSPVNSIKFAAQNMGIFNLLSFYTVKEPQNSVGTYYYCKFFLKNILISTGRGHTEYSSKAYSAKAAVLKLSSMDAFRFKDIDEIDNQIMQTEESSHQLSSCDQAFSLINRDLLEASIRRQFVIMDNRSIRGGEVTPASMLFNSASFCQRKITYEYSEVPGTSSTPDCRVDLLLDGEIVGTGISLSTVTAKREAAADAFSKLQKTVYTIKVKDEYADSFIVKRSQLIESEMCSEALSESNIGCKMLKGMGWTGGGIGKTSGIVEPIVAENHRFGQGLGFTKSSSDEKSFKTKIHCLLQDFKKSNSISDLLFSTEFSKIERKEIHKVASRYHLNSISYGVADDRRLIVRNKFNVLQLLDILTKAGGSTTKYDLVDMSSQS